MTSPKRPVSNWRQVERMASAAPRLTMFRGAGAGKVKHRKVTGHHKFMPRTDRERLCKILDWDHANGVR